MSRAWILGGIAGLTWISLVASGLYALNSYAAKSGSEGVSPDHWPSETALTVEPGKIRIILTAHPHCPCTRATLRELAQVLAHAPDRATTQVLFLRPKPFPPS